VLLQQEENLHPPVYPYNLSFIALRNLAADADPCARIPYAVRGFALDDGAATRVGFYCTNRSVTYNGNTVYVDERGRGAAISSVLLFSS